MPLAGPDEVLGSGDPGDTHNEITAAPSGCGKTALILRLLLEFCDLINEQMDHSQQAMGPSPPL
jgi:hypothetical protein